MKTLPGIWTSFVKVIQFYIETGAVNKKGLPVRAPCIQRSLYVTVTGGMEHEPRRYRIFQVRRNGETTYSLRCVPVVAQPYWTNPKAGGNVWYKEVEKYKPHPETGEPELQWGKVHKDDKAMVEQDAKKWLNWRLGDRTQDVWMTFLTQPPESAAA